MVIQNPNQSQRSYFPGLDALRGIAILLVVFHHFFDFSIGWIGVDLFFVLSGFLITSILLRTKSDAHYFRNFYIKRVLRIFPIYFLLLILFYSFCSLFTTKTPGSTYYYYVDSWYWFFTFTQNFLIITKGHPPEPYLAHLWSLALEEQFYFFWPLIIFLVRNICTLKTLITIVFLLALFIRLFLFFFPFGHENYYFNLLTRADSLAAGSFLAVYYYNRQSMSKLFLYLALFLFLTFLCVTFLITESFTYNTFLFRTIGYSISAVFFMAVCYQVIKSNTILDKLEVLKYIGRISYGIYIYHIPVLLIGGYIFEKLGLTNYIIGTPPINRVFFLFITITVSVASYRWIELPILRWKNKVI